MTINVLETLALDRSATNRTYDVDGRLRVSHNNISKANVCGYYGREIPNSKALGLDQNKMYMLYRDPEEMAKAVNTFNNLPLLDEHIPVSAVNPQKDVIIGSLGSNAAFDGEYLTNDLIVWDDQAIAGIHSKEKTELSPGYRYRADMTPGIAKDGTPFDGVMRDIIGNHLAVVEVGRTGSDVIVGDSKPLEIKNMSKAAKLEEALKPFFAADADPEKIRTAILALDAEKDDQAEDEDDDEEDDKEKQAKDSKPALKKSKIVKSKKAAKIALDAESESDEDDDLAEDEDDEEDKDDKDKPAMDAAAMRRDIKANVMASMRAVREAESLVRPVVGEVAAMDSADEVFRFALDSLNVDHKGVKGVGLRRLFEVASKQPEPAPRAQMGMDSATRSGMSSLTPNLPKLKRV